MNCRNFLIIAASIGSGHIKASEAIAETIKNQNPNSNITLIDFSEWNISYATAFMKFSYLLILKIIPNLYKLMYKFTGGKSGGLSVQNLISFITKGDIATLVKKYNPDVIICTHPFPAGACSLYKRQNKSSFLFSTIITDYSIHQMWIYDNVDCYFVARESMKHDLLVAGLEENQIFVTGIPISNRYFNLPDKQILLEKYSLNSYTPIILIMGGGLGLGELDTVLKQIEQISVSLQLLVITGKNKALQKKLQILSKLTHHKIKIWGYCTEIPELMSISDLLVTKPGALTITEAHNSALPMILHDPIPGPERDNAVYAATRGTAIWATTSEKLVSAITTILNDSKKMLLMKKNAILTAKPYAAQNIYKIIIKLLDFYSNKQG